MATNTPNNVDRIESASDITLAVAQGAGQGSGGAAFIEVPISRLDTTKDISISEIRESSVKATGYSVDAIKYSGTMMFKGSRKTKTAADGTKVHLDDLLYDEHGVPEPVQISITHDLVDDLDPDKTEAYTTVLVTNESYQVRNEQTTEQAYDWIAFSRDSDEPN
jgi:hypothetical protein